jgi:hypothetical protein
MKAKTEYLSIADLKHQVLFELKGKVGNPIQTIGYIEPGHGLRGKQRWLYTDDDLSTMYQLHKKKEIILWCFGECRGGGVPRVGIKRPLPDIGEKNAPRKSTKYTDHVDRISEVGEIEEKLKDKHRDEFTDVQYRAWANLIKMKKHESLNSPPDLPFWRGTTKKETCGVSPGKRINLRGQCVDQLLKWHELLEKGAITKTQYAEFQSTIMDEVKKF